MVFLPLSPITERGEADIAKAKSLSTLQTVVNDIQNENWATVTKDFRRGKEKHGADYEHSLGLTYRRSQQNNINVWI